MGLAQAVSLPRGGGTLKGQRPLPAAAAAPAGPPPPSRPHLRAAPRTPFREVTRGRSPAETRGRARAGPLRRWRFPGGGGRGARAEGARRAGSQAASGIGRLGRAGPRARRRAGAVRREPGESREEKDKEEKERVAGSLWVPGASS